MLRIVNEPIRKCSKCKHSITLCECQVKSEPLPTDINNAIPDWAIITKLDIDHRRAKLDISKAYQQQLTERLLKEKPNMPIKIIEEAARKPRRVMTGKFAAVSEVIEMWESLKKLPQGKAIEVHFDKATIDRFNKDGVENPCKAIVNAIRRKMHADELPFDVYANDDNSFTVLRDKPTRAAASK